MMLKSYKSVFPTAVIGKADDNGSKSYLSSINNKEEKMTIICITHYMEEALDADRVIVMHNGEIKMEGEPRKIFTKVGELNEMGLDVPQILKVFLELRKLGFPARADIYTVEEAKQEFFRLKNLIEGEAGFVK